MLHDLLAYSPDLILYYAGFKDHSSAALERYPGPQLWRAGRLNFLRHWLLYKRIQMRMLLLPLADIEEWVTWSNGWARPYRDNLTTMYADATRAGVRFVAVNQVLQNMNSPVSFRTRGWHLLLRQYDALAIQQHIVSSGQFLDVRSAFASTREQLFYDPVHLTPRGNDILARAVASALKDRGLVPR